MSLKFVLFLLPALLLLLPPFVRCGCPDGFVQWHSDCYFFNANETEFAAAETKCNYLRGNLASVHDGFLNSLLSQNSGNYFHANAEVDFWIGGTNLMSPPNWTWTDGTLFDFQEWQKGKPLAAESCAAVNIVNGSWSAQNCFKAKPFVCKTNDTSPTPFTVAANCTVGWYYLDITQSCYGTVKSMQASWNYSETTCKTYGAHLPSIHSYEEETFLRTFTWVAGINFWIGMYSNDYAEHTYNWTDGSKVNYINWSTGYPSQNASSCVGLDHFGFFDCDCNYPYNWLICKKPLN